MQDQASRQGLRLGDRPEDDHRLALDEIIGDEADVGEAAVLGIVAVVTHDEDMSGGHRRQRIIRQRLFEDVVLAQQLLIQEYLAVLDLDRIAGHGDHALDEVAARVARIAEDDDLATLRLPHAIDELVDDEALARLQGRPHGRAVHDVKLHDELTDDEGEHDGDDDRHEPILDFFSQRTHKIPPEKEIGTARGKCPAGIPQGSPHDVLQRLSRMRAALPVRLRR